MRVFDFVPDGIQDCNVTAWIHTEGESKEMKARKLPSIIICPGGGYEYVSDREGDPVAQFYFAAGYNTFVLRYSVGELAKDYYPLRQLASTITHIRRNAEAWHVDRERIAVWGGSAGGHLAASLGTLANTEAFHAVFSSEEDIRPNAMVLIYPVITADDYAHVGSIRNVSGSQPGTDQYAWFGLNNHVDGRTPPTFLYHTVEDKCVPVQNSLRLADALSAAKVPYELHILPDGYHGMAVCTAAVGSDNAYNRRWVEWSIRWLNKLFGFQG